MAKTIHLGQVICVVAFLVTVGGCRSSQQEQIAFFRFHEAEPFDSTEIYVMNINGNKVTQLTFDESHSHSPAWSPDGTRIAFTSRREGDRHIYVMDTDGNHVVKLSNVTGQTPAWSPDGIHIAFVCFIDHVSHICIMDAGGENIVQLTNDEITTTRISWSSDGKRIAFDCPGTPVQICIMDADGSNRTRLTEGPEANFGAVWLPDGNQIAFVSTRNSFNYNIFIMDADGTDVVQAVSGGENTFPSWSPDGQHLAFNCNGGICVISTDGSNAHRIADTGFDPVWSPAP